MAKYDWNPWDVLGGAPQARRRGPGGVSCRLDAPGGAVREPAADVVETREAFVIQVDLPGVRIEDVELHVAGRELVVYGAARPERDVDGSVYHTMERLRGVFGRSFRLPRGVDSAAVTASLEAGVLTITAPKRRAGGPLRIEVDG